MLVEPNATRTAQTAGKSSRFTIRSDLHDEATIPSMGVIGRAQSERYELIALRIELRSECVLVVIGISPSIRDGLKPVGNAIAIGVAHTRQFATLGYSERIVLPYQSKDFIEPRCESVKGRCRLLSIDAIDQKNLAVPSADGDLSIG